MKTIKKILIILLLALVAIQLYRPEKNNAEYRDVLAFETDTKPSKDVKMILESKCYDCHSNKTEYPWYAEVTPFSFWIADHIKEGNEHFNVSKWETYTDKKRDHKLHELIEEIEEGEMPLNEYTWLHGGITEKEKELVIAWAKKAKSKK